MDIEKSTILLEKINNLHQIIQKDADNISSIEKDLLKDYIKALYESLVDKPTSQKADSNSTTTVKNEPVIEVTDELPGSSGSKPEEVEAEIEKPIEIKKPVYKKPRIIEVPEEIQEELASTPPKESSEIRHEAPTSTVSDEIEELFDDSDSSQDLSSRLANAPIKDLTKSISINERILTVNELFGGNIGDFDQTLKTLNACTSFKEAKFNILADKAIEYAWSDTKRVKKAKKFIKLIRRRYL